MVVGQQALDGYLLETGRLRPSIASGIEINVEYLNNLANEAINLLGQSYERLRASDQRGKLSPTPPPRRHRLIELIDYSREAADSLRNSKPGEFLTLDHYMFF
jgi:hypothetical protein